MAKKKIQKVEKDPKAEALELAKELSKSIDSMIDKRDEKVSMAREHLAKSLDVQSEKYRTANGVMAAMDVVREVYSAGTFDVSSENFDFYMGKEMSAYMSGMVSELAKKVRKAEVVELDTICDDLFDHDFDGDMRDLVRELMILEMCQQFAPAAADIKGFYDSANEEIDKSQEELDKTCKENDIDQAALVEE